MAHRTITMGRPCLDNITGPMLTRAGKSLKGSNDHTSLKMSRRHCGTYCTITNYVTTTIPMGHCTTTKLCVTGPVVPLRDDRTLMASPHSPCHNDNIGHAMPQQSRGRPTVVTKASDHFVRIIMMFESLTIIPNALAVIVSYEIR